MKILVRKGISSVEGISSISIVVERDLRLSSFPLSDLFFWVSGSFEHRIDTLVFDHLDVQSIRRAMRNLSAAGTGKIEKRLPISVRKFEESRLLIVDGNSTAASLLICGRSEILCRFDG